jgi:disulfide bond formation protein DsbB
MKNLIFLIMATFFISALSLTACGGGSAPPPAEKKAEAAPATAAPAQAAKKGDPVAGEKSFASICAACHGPKGEGVQGLGKDMTTSEFIAGKTDDELVAFIKVGRDPSDPLNTTGVAMPPKGGNPAFSDDDLYNIVAYIRTIHK